MTRLEVDLIVWLAQFYERSFYVRRRWHERTLVGLRPRDL